MESIWAIIPSYENDYKIDAGRCRHIISNSKSVDDIRFYIESVLTRLKKGDCEAIKDAWTVAIPLSYRLAIDDTASNYRIASQLKEAVLWLDKPLVMSCVKAEIEWLFKSSCGISYSDLVNVQENILRELKAFSKLLNGNWRVYTRYKSISSILEKLTKVYLGKKLPKNQNPNILDSVRILTNQFEEQVIQRLHGNHINKKSYNVSSLEWVVPDLLAFTMQLTEDSSFKRGLGGVKSKYNYVYKRLNLFPANIFHGPFYSKAWHMNRMVCYMDWKLDLFSSVSFELFVRTDLDYFIGYGNYWRYKGISLFQSPSVESIVYRKKFLSSIRSCKNFREVQEILFKEVTSGQLDLF